MARMYSRKKGKHGSKKPIVRTVPSWVVAKKNDVEKLVVDLAKERHNSAVIGTILRDQHGIPDVKILAEKSITQMMRENKLYPEFPEDLMSLFKKAVELHNHVKRQKSDRNAVANLQHLESKIRRLVKYYKRENKINKDFKYDPEKVKLIVQK